MSDPAISLQAALYHRLSSELTTPIYDSVPMGAVYPYITIDNEQVTNTSPISGRKRANRYIYLSVWSNYKGQSEVKRINAEIEAALNERPLTLAASLPVTVMPSEALHVPILPPGQSPGRAVSVRVVRTSSNRDADGVTYQGSITLRVITQQ